MDTGDMIAGEDRLTIGMSINTITLTIHKTIYND
ncbi:hypothetical protein SAMN06265218_10947 [Fodinibius sediminis]|uniref:Uncharacterized protein n=1 Tax=Fodinibius sediminis TaxID=1214077 RepID=A0A521DBN6_9BACT|nr:hypothetical protein SAMN06265218_10947 [Fodinibius sediminis]